LGLLAAQPREADDRQGVDGERVGGGAEVAADVGAAFGVDDGEVEAELVGHLVAPLHGEAGGADDKDPLGAVAQQEFLRDQAGFDGLAQADVVCEQQVDAGCLDRSVDRFELVVLDRDAGPERGLEGLDVGRGDGGPADRVEEGGQTLGPVEAGGVEVRQGADREDLAAGLDLPDHLQCVAVAAVLDAL